MNIVFVCDSAQLSESNCQSISHKNKAYFALRYQGEVHAYLNRCPHIGAPLQFRENQFLSVDKTLIQCAMHGALFTIESGECVSGPCPGQALTKIPVREEYGTIYLELDE